MGCRTPRGQAAAAAECGEPQLDMDLAESVGRRFSGASPPLACCGRPRAPVPAENALRLHGLRPPRARPPATLPPLPITTTAASGLNGRTTPLSSSCWRAWRPGRAAGRAAAEHSKSRGGRPRRRRRPSLRAAPRQARPSRAAAAT